MHWVVALFLRGHSGASWLWMSAVRTCVSLWLPVIASRETEPIGCVYYIQRERCVLKIRLMGPRGLMDLKSAGWTDKRETQERDDVEACPKGSWRQNSVFLREPRSFLLRPSNDRMSPMATLISLFQASHFTHIPPAPPDVVICAKLSSSLEKGVQHMYMFQESWVCIYEECTLF